MLVALLLEAGLLLILIPWSAFWDRNYFVEAVPAVGVFLTNNFVRGAVAPMTLAFEALSPSMGVLAGGQIVGVVTFALALGSIALLDETHGRDLDFVEE